MFDILYSRQAIIFLKKADKKLTKRILGRIGKLKSNPIEKGTKSIIGYKERLFRARVGDYRILYEIDFKSSKIGIVKIDKRSRAYK